jgi:hypothetical protein
MTYLAVGWWCRFPVLDVWGRHHFPIRPGRTRFPFCTGSVFTGPEAEWIRWLGLGLGTPSHPHYTSLPFSTLLTHVSPSPVTRMRSNCLHISGIARIQSHAVRPQSPLDNRHKATDYTNGKARMHNSGLLSGSLPYAVSLLNGIVLEMHAPQPKRYSPGQPSSSWGSMGIRCYIGNIAI